MKTALIGYTGFVGSNLAREHQFSDLYNSSNIADIEGKVYDLVVSAGARAEKWRINQEPEKDLAEIDGLISHLKTIVAKRFVLISTIDVYKNPHTVDEDTPIDTEGLSPYGSNRFHLEQFCRDQFDATIVRLPGLFGQGLKKNVIYDFLNDNNINSIHYAGMYQYYNLDHVWDDIKVALDNNLKLVNFATEPVLTGNVAKDCFGMDFTNQPEGVVAGSYDMHTKYASVFGASGYYIYSAKQELSEIKSFVEKKRAAK
jgi:hypothetical protein